MFAPGHGRELLAWLLPVALATTSSQAGRRDADGRTAPTSDRGARSEHRRTPGCYRAGAAERHVAVQLTRALVPEQVTKLDALLQPKEATAMSVLAWSRQPPAAPGHRALAGSVLGRGGNSPLRGCGWVAIGSAG